MYADKITSAIKNTLAVTEKRRKVQIKYNEKHGIVPRTIKRDLGVEMGVSKEILYHEASEAVITTHEKKGEYLDRADLEKKIREYERLMRQAAKEFRFEDAARYRDLMRQYQQIELRLT